MTSRTGRRPAGAFYSQYGMRYCHRVAPPTDAHWQAATGAVRRFRKIYCIQIALERGSGETLMSGSLPNTNWHLAQINVGRLLAPRGDHRVAPFFDALDRVNELAERSPGFVWRLQTEAGNATEIQATPDPLFLLNMSVWVDAEALFAFVYRSGHTPEMARRREYFERFEGAYQALWWVPAGHVPGIDEGLSRLWRIDRYGPTREAFTFKMRFPAPGLAGPPKDMEPDPWCIGRA